MNGKPASAPCGRAGKTDQMKQTGQAGQLKLRRMLILIFAAYALFMLYLLLVRNRGGLPADPAAWRREQFNLIPFLSVREYLADLFGTDPVKTRAAVINLGGNIFLFVPFGFLIPVLFARFRSPSRVLLLMAAVMTAVEVLQLLTCRGHCDVDDLILNLIGVAAGVFLYSTITRIRNKKRWVPPLLLRFKVLICPQQRKARTLCSVFRENFRSIITPIPAPGKRSDSC